MDHEDYPSLGKKRSSNCMRVGSINSYKVENFFKKSTWNSYVLEVENKTATTIMDGNTPNF